MLRTKNGGGCILDFLLLFCFMFCILKPRMMFIGYVYINQRYPFELKSLSLIVPSNMMVHFSVCYSTWLIFVYPLVRLIFHVTSA